LARQTKNKWAIVIDGYVDLALCGVDFGFSTPKASHPLFIYAGRSVLRLILADMRVTASLQANPNETQNSPAYQEYLADVDSQVRRFIAPSRLTFTAYHLGMMPLFRFSVEKALSEQAPAENYLYKSITDKAAAASNNVSVTAIKEKADRKHIITMFATARGFLAFIGALYLDQVRSPTNSFLFL
jgi:hypothetical protein